MGIDFQPHRLPFIGGFLENPAEQEAARQSAHAAASLQAYRGPQAQAYQNALRNSLGGYQGAMNTLAGMGGSGPNVAQMTANPMQPGMTGIGAPLPPAPKGGGLAEMIDPLGGTVFGMMGPLGLMAGDRGPFGAVEDSNVGAAFGGNKKPAKQPKGAGVSQAFPKGFR